MANLALAYLPGPEFHQPAMPMPRIQLVSLDATPHWSRQGQDLHHAFGLKCMMQVLTPKLPVTPPPSFLAQADPFQSDTARLSNRAGVGVPAIQ